MKNNRKFFIVVSVILFLSFIFLQRVQNFPVASVKDFKKHEAEYTTLVESFLESKEYYAIEEKTEYSYDQNWISKSGKIYPVGTVKINGEFFEGLKNEDNSLYQYLRLFDLLNIQKVRKDTSGGAVEIFLKGKKNQKNGRGYYYHSDKKDKYPTQYVIRVINDNWSVIEIYTDWGNF